MAGSGLPTGDSFPHDMCKEKSGAKITCIDWGTLSGSKDEMLELVRSDKELTSFEGQFSPGGGTGLAVLMNVPTPRRGNGPGSDFHEVKLSSTVGGEATSGVDGGASHLMSARDGGNLICGTDSPKKVEICGGYS